MASQSFPAIILVAGSPLIATRDAVTLLEQTEGSLAYLDTIGTRAEDLAYKRMRLILESAYSRLHHRTHRQGIFHDHDPLLTTGT